MTSFQPKRWQADLGLASVAFVWGTTFVVVKGALADISTVYFLALRFSLAALCLLLLFAVPFSRASPRTVWRGLRGGMAAGCFLWLGYMLQTFGLKYTSAGNSGFLTGLYVILTPIIGFFVYRRAPRLNEMAGIVTATAGMLLLTVPNAHASLTLASLTNGSVTNGSLLRMNKGDLLTIACAVAFAFHLLVLGYFSQREMIQAVALGQVATSAVLSSFALLVEPPVATWTHNLIGAIVLTAIFATALAFALQTWGQKYTTATRTALLFALEPVFALVTAVLAGHEKLTFAGVSGGLLILAGILAVELKPRAGL